MFEHRPVLLHEVINGLNIKPNGFYVDATFGRGGHSKAILQRLNADGKLLVIDKDHEAIEYAKSLFLHDNRLLIRHGAFSNLSSWIEELGLIKQVDGILLDVGVSSPQLDDSSRGFSFMRNGPLDMRMDVGQKHSAMTWINSAKEAELISVFKEYGEERFSKRIARAIISERLLNPFATTEHLSKVVCEANPAWEKGKHPATRVFQAIRIFINDELNELKLSLEASLNVLKIGGRLAVITFHSLEDRIVKDFIKKNADACGVPVGVPLTQEQLKKIIKIKKIGKMEVASTEEVVINPRARTAKLRILEKL